MFKKNEDDSGSDDVDEDGDGEQHIHLDLQGDDDYPYFVLVQFMQDKKDGRLSDAILLDNQANVNMFCNPKLLTNIRKGPRTMTVNCQSGTTSTDWIGD